VGTPAAGAIVTFRGQVRDHDEGRAVVAIDYEAHPDADAVVRRIAEDAARGSGAAGRAGTLSPSSGSPSPATVTRRKRLPARPAAFLPVKRARHVMSLALPVYWTTTRSKPGCTPTREVSGMACPATVG